MVSEPGANAVLIVDFGTTTSAANLLVDGRVHHITDPLSGGRTWPSSILRVGDDTVVGERAERRKQDHPHGYAQELKRRLGAGHGQALDDVRDVLVALRDEAARISHEPVTRILLTIPGDWHPGDTRRRDLEAAARAAGFVEVEMLFEPVAAAYAAAAQGTFVDGQRVLVHDLGGGSFDMALVELGRPGHEVLPAHSIPDTAGHEIDEQLVAVLRTDGPGTDDPAGALELRDVARELKARLSSEPEAARRSWLGPGLRLTTEQLRAAAEEVIAATIGAAQRFLADLEVKPAELDGVLLAGGGARMALVVEAVTDAFSPVPVRRAVNPELAVVDGATAWRQRAGQRRGASVLRRPGEIPMRWDLPGGAATVSRWLIEPGQRFVAGDPIVRVTLTDGAHWELTAAHGGTLATQHAPVGRRVADRDWLATALAPRPGTATGRMPTCLWQRVELPSNVVTVSPDVAVAVVGYGETLTKVDLGTGASDPLGVGGQGIADLSLDRSGAWLAVAYENGRVQALDLRTYEATALQFPSVGRYTRVAWSPSDDRLAVSGVDGKRLHLWTPGTAEPGEGVELPWATNCTATTLWSSDGSRLAAAGPTVAVVSPDTPGDAVVLAGENRNIRQVHPGAAGCPVIVGAANQRAVIWYDAASGERTRVENAANNIVAMAVAGDQALIGIANAGGVVEVRNSAWELRADIAISGAVKAIAFSDDGYRLLVATDKDLQIWSLDADTAERA